MPKDMWRQVQYLESGKAIFTTPGLSRDVFREEFVIGPLHILTDGTYAWPSDYPYYVKNYNVRVPDEVVAHMARRGWTIAPFDLAACEL